MHLERAHVKRPNPPKWKIGWKKQPGKDYSLTKVEGPLLEPKQEVVCVEEIHYERLFRLQRLFDAGINCKVWCHQGEGWHGFVGGCAYRGWAEEVEGKDLAEVADKIWAAARKLYPKADCFKVKP
jgi:hypothetical protein